MNVRRAALRLGLVVVSTVLSVLLLDVAFRAFERVFWIHELPAESAVYDLATLDYNDHEGILPAHRGDDALRVLVIGDSFVESATRAPFSYASRLQAILAEASGERVRVVNLGRNGTSFADYLAQLRHWTERVDFDAVLIGVYVGNDWLESTDMLWLEGGRKIDREIEDASALRYGPGVDLPRRFPLRFLDYVYALYWGRVYEADALPEGDPYHPRSLQYPADFYHEAQSRMVRFYQPEAMLSEVAGHVWLHRLLVEARALEERGKHVAISVAPPHFVVDARTRERALALSGDDADTLDAAMPGALVAEEAREVGLQGPVIDLYPCLLAVNERGDEPYWGTNTHWSVRGNEVVAEVLARALAPDWLGARIELGDDLLSSCPTAPRAARPAEREAIQRAVAQGRDWRALEQGTLAGLAGRHFATPEALFDVLRSRGLRLDDGRIRGAFWGYPHEKQIQIQRPHGLRRFVRPTGFATDAGAPDASLLIAYFHRGRLVGIGRTHRPFGDDEQATLGIEDLPRDRPHVVFESLIPRLRPTPGSADDLWVVAVSPTGRFALLPPDENGPDGVSLPWGRK